MTAHLMFNEFVGSTALEEGRKEVDRPEQSRDTHNSIESVDLPLGNDDAQEEEPESDFEEDGCENVEQFAQQNVLMKVSH